MCMMPGDTLCITGPSDAGIRCGLALLTGWLLIVRNPDEGRTGRAHVETWGKPDAVVPGDISFSGRKLDRLSTIHRCLPVLPVF